MVGRRYCGYREGGHDAMVKMLLENKADANAEGNCGYTAIQLAAFDEHKEVGQLLMEKGAYEAKDVYGLQGLFVEMIFTNDKRNKSDCTGRYMHHVSARQTAKRGARPLAFV